MHRTTHHHKLARALDLLIGGEGTLPWRLFQMAPCIAAVPARDFADHRLRRQFQRLRDDLTMLGFYDDDPDGDPDGRPWGDLRRDEAMVLAVRFLTLCMDVALQWEEKRQ